MTQQIPIAVLLAYQISPEADYERVSGGLINSTWVVRDGNRTLILQKLNHIFDRSVNSKIAGVTKFLANGPARTTRLLKTSTDALHVLIGDDCWRCLSYVRGRTYVRITDTNQARLAGRALANFHAAMQVYRGHERLPILAVHDLEHHQQNLVAAMHSHKEHQNYGQVSAAADEILNAIVGLAELPDFPLAVVHGDPKITNFIFSDASPSACLIDLDTIGRGQILHELGDAFRSWCNPLGEECAQASFDPEVFTEAFMGYREVSGTPLNAEQSRYIGIATEMICLELAARFCADALNESYFAWDNQRYASASEHQLLRASGQLTLAKSVAANRQKISQSVETAWR